MSLFDKSISQTDDYLIRMDAMNMALNYSQTSGLEQRNNREFLRTVDAFFGYLKGGTVPDILGEATKTVLKGK